MGLPVVPPLSPMLCKSVGSIEAVPDDPPGQTPTIFEPKWDGFRCIVFRDGDEVVLGSRNEKPLTRYFPELPPALRAQLPSQVVIDGEIVIATDHGLDFDLLSQRIHPAESRVNKLSVETPASFVAFDLLALGDESWMGRPFVERRARLEELLADAEPPVFLTPATTDRATAQDWFVRFEGAGLDGVVAKKASQTYEPNKRTQLKVKHKRTADCVVAGFRIHKDGNGVGSLLLGLHDDDGRLHHVGVAASFTEARRRELLDELEPYRPETLEDHPWREWAEAEGITSADQRMPGGLSRWSGGKDLSWFPLRPELVVEVAYENVQHGRFRHGARFQRWRTDREPASCTYAQLEEVTPYELHEIFRV